MSERLQAVLSQPPQGVTRLIAYLMAGDPEEAATLRRLRGLAEAGVDILELGVPFSDPMADGPVIQAAGERALACGMTVKKTLELIAEFRLTHQTPVLLMSYLNPLLRYGWDAFVQAAVQAGVDGLILPDLPWREGQVFRRQAAEQVGERLTFIPMIAQTSEEEDIEALANVNAGFIYVLSRNGITGGEATIPSHVLDFVRNLSTRLAAPYCVGFGIQKNEQVKRLAPVCNGVIVGSALINQFATIDQAKISEAERIEKEQAVYAWVGELKQR